MKQKNYVTKYRIFGLIFLIIILLLGWYKNSESVMVTDRTEKNSYTEQCLALKKTNPSEVLLYIDKADNDIKKNVWLNRSKIRKNKNIYNYHAAVSKWFGSKVKLVTYETFNPERTWSRSDDYCFNKEDSIIGIYSALLIPGKIRVIRSWQYFSDGSIESSDIKIEDWKTKKPIDTIDVSYMDNPPYLLKNYADLVEHLKLPIMSELSTVTKLTLEEMRTTDYYVNIINKNLTSYVSCEDLIFGLSTEGASLFSYYNADDLVKIDITYYGETGKLQKEIYLKDNTVNYIRTLYTNYTASIYVDGFDIASEVQNQFYFKEGKLSLWIKNGEIIDPESEEFSIKNEKQKNELADLKINQLIKRNNCDEVIYD